MNSHYLLRLGSVLLLCLGIASLALLLLFTPAQFATALDRTRGLASQLFTDTVPNPITSPLTPPPESLPVLKETGAAESVSQSSLPFHLLGLLCLLPLCLILALVVIWRRIRRTSADKAAEVAGKATATASAEPALPARPYLRHRGVLWELHESQTLGRDPQATWVITEAMTGWQTVSAMHAEISLQQDRWVIKDLDSSNGIYINGIRTGRNFLQDGDKLRLGAVELVFCTGEQVVQQ